MTFRITPIAALSALMLFLTSCEKSGGCPSSLDLSTEDRHPTAGTTFTLTAKKGGDLYSWNGPGVNEITGSNTLTIYNAKVSHRGVYSVGTGFSDCNIALTDTFYVHVMLPQGNPPCAATTNVITSTSLPGVDVTRTTKGMNSTYHAMSLTGRGLSTHPNFTVLFNAYSGNTEPEDGIYTTTNVPPSFVTFEPNRVSISFIFNSSYWHCRENAKVYVKHINGKLSVTFCDLVFESSPAGISTFSGNITEL